MNYAYKRIYTSIGQESYDAQQWYKIQNIYTFKTLVKMVSYM